MQIRSTDPSHSRSIEDLDQPSTAPASPASRGSVERATPDWDRIPTLEAATSSAVESGGADTKKLGAKIEKLGRDLKELHDALAPYARECKEAHHGLHEMEQAVKILEEAKHTGMLAPAVVAFAMAKAEHGLRTFLHGFAGMRREAPEAVRRAEPALAKVVDDLADIKGSLTPAIDRPVMVRG
jgi:hypothetical protein